MEDERAATLHAVTPNLKDKMEKNEELCSTYCWTAASRYPLTNTLAGFPPRRSNSDDTLMNSRQNSTGKSSTLASIDECIWEECSGSPAVLSASHRLDRHAFDHPASYEVRLLAGSLPAPSDEAHRTGPANRLDSARLAWALRERDPGDVGRWGRGFVGGRNHGREGRRGRSAKSSRRGLASLVAQSNVDLKHIIVYCIFVNPHCLCLPRSGASVNSSGTTFMSWEARA